MVKRTTQKLVEKCVKTKFNKVWFIIVVKKVGDKFYKDFVASFIADLLGFKGLNLGFTSKVQKTTRARAIVQQKSILGHIATRLQ
jgi:hypothetical protein